MRDPIAQRGPESERAGRYIFAGLAAVLIALAVLISTQHSSPSAVHASAPPAARPAPSLTTAPPAIAPNPEDRGVPAPVPPGVKDQGAARASAVAFSVGLARCLGAGRRCARPPDELPAYSGKLAAYLRGAVRQRVLHSAVLSMSFYCPIRAVSTVRFDLPSGNSLVMHPNLVRQAHGWKVYSVPELPVHIAPPSPLHVGAQGTC